jgi:hypothetical protein
MSTFTPRPYSVFNEFDSQGLLLGLPRLLDEKNTAYKQRILDVFVHRANSTYRGLINGITRELGLTIQDTLEIVSSTSMPWPAIKFQDTKCYLYSDISKGILVNTFDIWEKTGGNFYLNQLVDSINNTGLFVATVNPGINPGQTRSMTIFKQSSATMIDAEPIDTGYNKIKLQNNNLIPTSVSLSATNLTQRVSNLSSLLKPGQYYIDYTNGILYTTQAPATGSKIRYESISYDYVFQSSPVIINNLQSSDFQTKMFQQVAGDFINYINGAPTDLGADLINELLSVFSTAWSK